jgi:hypothetical protein
MLKLKRSEKIEKFVTSTFVFSPHGLPSDESVTNLWFYPKISPFSQKTPERNKDEDVVLNESPNRLVDCLLSFIAPSY